MYINDIDNLFDTILNNFYVYLTENNVFKILLQDTNFVKYQNEILNYIKRFIDNIPQKNILAIIKKSYYIDFIINSIKRRQKYRPFSPCILGEFRKEYFKGPMNEYMQFVSEAKHDYKSVTHIDGTARVQVVNSNCKSIIRPILEEWYEQTGCPMLLNTSLNIKGKPMVNDEKDSKSFERLYGVKVF